MSGEPSPIIPYCGVAPLPDTLWLRWNLDPVLLATLFAGVCAYAVGTLRLNRKAGFFSRSQQAAFYSGWAITTAALISPLCALSVSLFVARVGQHMILALLAAPLVVAGRPFAAIAGLWPLRADLPRRAPGAAAWPAAPLASAGLFAVLLWFWHAPAPYAATFVSTPVYWAMHLSLFGAALWLWSGLLDRSPARMVPAIGAGMMSSVQMGLLGALITFAPRPLYAPHALTTASWGLTPLQDQQFGGAIMWVPGCVVFLAAAMLMLWLALSQSPLHHAPSHRIPPRRPGIATP